MSLAFMTLSGIEEPVAVHEAATDLVCTLLVRLEDVVGQGEPKLRFNFKKCSLYMIFWKK